MYPAKSEQKVHMYYEREKRGFDFNVRGLCTAASAFFDELRMVCLPQGTAAGQDHYHKVAWYFIKFEPGGLLVNSALGKSHDRLTDREFISTSKDSTEGTKPVAYVTVVMGSSSCVTIKDTFCKIQLHCMCVFIPFFSTR